MYFDDAIISHIGEIDSLEKPAVMADFLLRFDQVQSVAGDGDARKSVIVSPRTSSKTFSAADLIRRLLRKIGEGGGHRTKAGGFIPMSGATAGEITRLGHLLRRRYLRALKIRGVRGQRSVSTLAPE